MLQIYIFAYVHTHVCVFLNTFRHIVVALYSHVNRVHEKIHTQTHTLTLTLTHTHTYTNMHTHTRTQTCTHTHTLTYTHVHSRA